MRWFLDHVVKPWHPTILALLTIAPMGYLVFAGPLHAPAVTRLVARDVCEQVQVGMTFDEVERMLGSPGERLVVLEKLPPEECAFYLRWAGEQFEFYVSFDLHRKVTSVAVREFDEQIGPC